MDRSNRRLPLALDAPACAAFLGGGAAVQAIPALPPRSVVLAGLALALGLAWVAARLRIRTLWWLALAGGALAWALLAAGAAMQARLPAALEGADIDLVGQVRGLPRVQPGTTGFVLRLESARLAGEPLGLAGDVRLAWYPPAPEIEPCSRLQVRARLKRPRGLVNPGGADSERSAAQRGVIAVGYVRQELVAAEPPAAFCLDAIRARIGRRIDARLEGSRLAPVLRALAIGDQQGLDNRAWQVLRATGTSHLVAISGLHVGLFAAFGALLGRALWKAFPGLTLHLPGRLLEPPLALLAAFIYGALAGFGVPTVRTLVMLAVALLARQARRGGSTVQALGLAAAVLVVADPLALLGAGFWLSFAGVAALLLVLAPGRGHRAWWQSLGRAQLGLSLALLPLTVWFFGQGSLAGPLANLIAVPWVSFVVVPLTVTAALLAAWVPALGTPLIGLAAGAVAPLGWLLESLAEWPLAQVHFPAAPAWGLALALAGVGWALLPRGVPGRWLAPALLLPLLYPARAPLPSGAFEVWMLDVGQGLSMLVRTREHSLLYDAGARFPSGFDLGQAAVVPSLRALGVRRLDVLVVSHGDNDHAGGAAAVLAAMQPRRALLGEPERGDVEGEACLAGEHWRWDGVEFTVLSPRPGARGNHASCVLQVRGRHGSALLTGDIHAAAERGLPVPGRDLPRPLVLAVPHHGSKTSSGTALLDAWEPALALVSAGHRNRYGHPHPDVVARYARRGIPLHGTAAGGWLAVRVDGSIPSVRQGRDERPAWWRER